VSQLCRRRENDATCLLTALLVNSCSQYIGYTPKQLSQFEMMIK